MKKASNKPNFENQTLTFQELCEQYNSWTWSQEYNEGYKQEFVAQFGNTFSSVSVSKTFETRYFKLLSAPSSIYNFIPRTLMFGKKMMQQLFLAYPYEHIDLFSTLFNENNPLADRIAFFTEKLENLRANYNQTHTPEKWSKSSAYKIDYLVATFFLFVFDNTKYPLASVNTFIKQYFEYMNIQEFRGLKGLGLYIFYYNYIHQQLLPQLQQNLHSKCSALDAQNFFWFVANRIANEGYRVKNIDNRAYMPMNIPDVKENLIEETEYAEDVDSTLLTKTDRKHLYEILDKKPTLAQVNQTKFQRNVKMAKLALENANFTCEADCDNKTFISAASNKPYMEAHHLIPMPCSSLYYDRYHVQLDRPENIVSLCPLCHRAIHFGSEEIKTKILRLLFNKRKDKLRSLNIDITFEELLQHYKK